VGDPVGADHAGVADVDHPGVGDVERDPKRHQECGPDRQPGDRRGRTQSLGAAEPDPQHAAEEIDERRIDERHRQPDVPRIERDLADPEREQHQQVEVDDSPPSPEVEQREEEDQRQRDPDVGGVQRVAELLRVAASHLPGDLVAGPGFADLAAAIVHEDLYDLLVAGEVADLPYERGLGLDTGLEATARGRLFGDLGRAVGDFDRLPRREVVCPGLLGEGSVEHRHGDRAGSALALRGDNRG
jgi:hypothetical protein